MRTRSLLLSLLITTLSLVPVYTWAAGPGEVCIVSKGTPDEKSGVCRPVPATGDPCQSNEKNSGLGNCVVANQTAYVCCTPKAIAVSCTGLGGLCTQKENCRNIVSNATSGCDFSSEVCCTSGFVSKDAIVTTNDAFFPNKSFQYELLEPLPGQEAASPELPSYLTALYNVSLVLLVISAVLMVSIGGFTWLTSAGNTAQLGVAKKTIFGAIIGLVAALVGWLIFNVISPDLVKINPNALSPTPSSGTAAPPGSVPGTPSTNCPSGVSVPCAPCRDCLSISGVENKGCGQAECKLNATLLSKIKNVSGVSGWRITESWPPTVYHSSLCHRDGTCADLNNSGGLTDPATIKKYYDAFKAAGLDVLYESKNCPPYIAVGVANCKTYSTMTNDSSFHVK